MRALGISSKNYPNADEENAEDVDHKATDEAAAAVAEGEEGGDARREGDKAVGRSEGGNEEKYDDNAA